MQYLIDASVYVFRAYYSMPDDMVDDAGNPINALYGFCRFVGDFMEQVTPEFVAVAFDDLYYLERAFPETAGRKVVLVRGQQQLRMIVEQAAQQVVDGLLKGDYRNVVNPDVLT